MVLQCDVESGSSYSTESILRQEQAYETFESESLYLSPVAQLW